MLALSPDDLMREGRAIDEYLADFTEPEDEIPVENRNKFPLHHKLILQCKDIYSNNYRFIIHLNTYQKRTILFNGNWGNFYELRFERLENKSFEEKGE